MTNTPHSASRRAVLGALTLPWLIGGCSTPLPLTPPPAGDADAAARLRESAQAHGLNAYVHLRKV